MRANGVIMQYFHWFTVANGKLWTELAAAAQELAQTGITAVWLPPCSKGSGGPIDVGYGCYDLFDLGEFDQNGSVRTTYGTKEELRGAIEELHTEGVQVYADVVFNHKDGGDEVEEVWVQEVDWHNRNHVRTDWHPIRAWTRFTFPGRGSTYSSMHWHWWCFDALSYNAETKKSDKLYRLKAKHFETEVSHEHGNYDYLLANDLDSSEGFVKGELDYWGDWLLQTTGVDGFRLDACKHIRASFFRNWLSRLRSRHQRELFTVGEYWSYDLKELKNYLDRTGWTLSLFDVPLHGNFHHASNSGNGYDLRTIFSNTLAAQAAPHAVTFVDNHDTQPYQSLCSPVHPWFKPLAYALILLRQEGYPCIFWADYHSASYKPFGEGETVVLPSHRWLIDKFLWARKAYGFGEQQDYFDHPNTIGWTRLGNDQHPGSMAVVLSNGSDGYKWMNLFRPHAVYTDITEHIPGSVQTNSEGWGQFFCRGGSVSVWLQE